MSPTLAMLTVLVFYFLIIIVIGFAAQRRTKTNADYVLGSRHLGSFVAALGAGASDMSGWLLLGLPGAVYLQGISAVWLPVGLVVGAWLNWRYVAPRLRIYTERVGDAQTIPAYVEARFNDHSGLLRIVTALVILVFFTFYAASCFVGGAVLAQQLFPAIDYQMALWIGAAVLVFYTCIGGFVAVNWVDCFQGTLMMGALLMVPLVTYMAITGNGPTETVQLENIVGSLFIDANTTTPLSFIAIISLLAWGLGYPGQPHILVRFMAVKKVELMPAARRICMSWMVMSLIGAVLVGITGKAYSTVTGQAPGNAEVIFLFLGEKLFNPWVVGILIAAVLSAIMSTIAAQLLACSTSLVEDIMPRMCGATLIKDQSRMWLGRMAVAMVALIAVLLAYDPNRSILQLVSYAWAGLGAAFGPMIVLSLWWSRMTKLGAAAEMITGALVVVSWKWGGIAGVYEIIPGVLLSLVAIYLGSLKK